MNVLSRRSVLAVAAAVVDVALHSPLGSQLKPKRWLNSSYRCPHATWRLCSRGWITPRSSRGCAGREAAMSWRASAGASQWARSCAPRCTLSTADPEDLGANSVLIERTIDLAVRRAGENVYRQSRRGHGRTDVRYGREVACAPATRRSGQRFRYLTARPPREGHVRIRSSDALSFAGNIRELTVLAGSASRRDG